MDNWLLYDGECPFCSRYVKLVRLRHAVGGLRLVNAREQTPEVEHALAAGFDVDEGMVLHLNGELYAGDACVNRLALLSTQSNAFNKVNAAIFRHAALSRALYPILRSCRNVTLALLGRKKIRAIG